MLQEHPVRDFTMVLDTEDAGMSTSLMNGANWEGECPDYLDKILRPCWTVIEMGACLGFYMLLEAKKVGKVYALEADPQNCDILVAAKKANKLYNIDIFNYAIGPEDGTLRFAQSPGRSDRGRLSQNGNIKVKSIRLDTFVKEQRIERVDLIRCDIESAEVHMVSGGIETLKAMRKGSWLFIDFHPLKFGKNRKPLDKAVRKLISLGFVPKKVSGPKVVAAEDFADFITRNSGFPRAFLRKER